MNLIKSGSALPCDSIDRTRTAKIFWVPIAFLVVSALLLSFRASADTQIAEPDPFHVVESLLVGGARQLALQYIDRNQNAESDADTWQHWERLRIRLYRERRDWSAISDRAKTIPRQMPMPFRQWLLTEAAEAELNAGNAGDARRYLRALIWRSGGKGVQLAHWRRLVIRSYLLDDRIDDAQTALLRYKLDYRATSDAWQLLHARVLMRARDYERAFRILGDIQSVDGKLLRLYSALHAGIYQPDRVIKRCQRLAGRSRLSDEQRQQIWVMAAAAARYINDNKRAVAFLELALNAGYKDAPNDPFFAVAPDHLWQAYFELAETVGNRERLLVGNDAPWLEQAEALAATDAVTSRAIYGFVSIRGGLESARQTAHQRLSTALLADDKATVARGLYSRSRFIGSGKNLPDNVRYQLANEALKVHDIQLAARWMKGLQTPPAGEDVDQWMLRRARTMVYAGETQSAFGLLQKMLASHQNLDVKLAKKTIQVLFDLQAMREHDKAYQLMGRVYSLVDQPSMRRELLYWMAESKDALGEHEKAAELYLRSATTGQPTGGDLWGQSARFQAAESLGRAGMVSDARSIFGQLLRITQDAKRRALIERKLDQLWLTENRNTTTP